MSKPNTKSTEKKREKPLTERQQAARAARAAHEKAWQELLARFEHVPGTRIIARQGFEVALEHLMAVMLRKKPKVRTRDELAECLAVSYERFSCARAVEKKAYLAGMAHAFECALSMSNDL